MGAVPKFVEYHRHFVPSAVAMEKILPYGTVLLFDKPVRKMPKPSKTGGYSPGMEVYADRIREFAQMNKRLRKGEPFKARMSEDCRYLEIFRKGGPSIERIHVNDIMLMLAHDINYVIKGGYLVPRILGKTYEEDIQMGNHKGTHPLFIVDRSYEGRSLRSLEMDDINDKEHYRVFDEKDNPVEFKVAPPPRRRRRK